jgi:hypothetical protein
MVPDDCATKIKWKDILSVEHSFISEVHKFGQKGFIFILFNDSFPLANFKQHRILQVNVHPVTGHETPEG